VIRKADNHRSIEENRWQSWLQDRSVDDMVLRIVTVIEEKFHPDMQAVHVAREVGYSPRHARRLCKRELGCSLVDLIRMKKMAIARQLLTEHGMSVREAAVKVGYKNTSHFAAAFRRTYGCNPSDLVRGDDKLPDPSILSVPQSGDMIHSVL
jgi:AraC-like DNA-binding protein